MLNIHSFIYFLKRETTIKKEKKIVGRDCILEELSN